jgi:SAM-dependent methyltransferase
MSFCNIGGPGNSPPRRAGRLIRRGKQMMTDPIRFDDGDAYERYMGKWSQIAGGAFLDWLAPKPSLRWLDVGCGNGAFTELIVRRCAPVAVHGIDPSEAQLAFARTRMAADVVQFRPVEFRRGDAMALPFPDDTFGAAVMPLVIFFVPDPARGIAEMARVVCSGGIVAAYAWDMLGGGFPYESLRDEMRAMGINAPLPPSPLASRIDIMRDLWTGGGFQGVETREITVQRTFAHFDDYWTTVLGGPSVSSKLKAMTPGDLASLKARIQARLPANDDGSITCIARANAVKGGA